MPDLYYMTTYVKLVITTVLVLSGLIDRGSF